MHKFFEKKKRMFHRKTAGFTLMEMLVTVGIFSILSGSLLFSYHGMNQHLNIDVLAHQVGQWIRDAQVSAMSVKYSRSSLGPSAAYPGYGLHFDITTPTIFIYFADLNGNNQYEPPVGAQKCGDIDVECVRQITFMQGNKISALCGSGAVGGVVTAPCGPYFGSTKFDIVFTRPNPDAVINGDLNGASFPTAYGSARITIASPSNYTHVVIATVTGQISIQ